MQKTFVYPAALLLLSVLLVSCKKEQMGNSVMPAQPNQSINASVASGETFTFVAGSTGALSVSKQALHFQVSEALNETAPFIITINPQQAILEQMKLPLLYLSDAAAPGISSNTGCPASHNTPASNGMNSIVIKLNVTK